MLSHTRKEAELTQRRRSFLHKVEQPPLLHAMASFSVRPPECLHLQ